MERMLFREFSYVIFLAAGFFACLVPVASAHIVGSSWESTSTPYLVDIGYDTFQFEAGAPVRFDFNLKDIIHRDPASYDQVWVRIIRDRETLLATGIHSQDIGPTTLLYTFAKEGNYTLEASYRRGVGGDEIATSTFPISVSPSDTNTGFLLPLLTLIGGLCLGFAVAFWWFRRAK